MRFIPNLNYSMDDIYVSSDDSYGSDQVDSDIEAELYSTVHHEMAPTEPDKNPSAEQNSSINLISVDENSTVVEKVLDSNSNRGMHKPKKNKQTQVVDNRKTGLKRKSNLVTSILDTIQVKKNSPRKKQKTFNPQNAVIDLVSSPGSSIIEIIDSDSDSDSSVILSEPDESSVRKLQTNIETVNVSDSESTCDSLKDSQFFFPGDADDTNNSNDHYKDVWQIDSVDLYRTKRKSTGRYHENAVSQCNNCNKKGHTAKFCTEPKVFKCIICGGAHHHVYCRNRICTRCLRSGHDSSRCYHRVFNSVCDVCNLSGHTKKYCPDLWRRFHLTTSDGHIVKGKLSDHKRPIYCFNCGSEGHYGYNCREARMGWTSPNWSSVISYEHPSVSQNKFIMDSDFGGPIPQLQHPNPAQSQNQINPLRLSRSESSQLQHPNPAQSQNQVNPVRLSKSERRRERFRKAQLNRLENLCKEISKVGGQKRRKQETSKNRIITIGNSKRGASRIKQETNFPRTPKANTISPACQCVDEMPKIKQTRRGPRKESKKRKRERLLRKEMQVLLNCS